MGPSPYPLPAGCIFREEFRNATLATQNGLVITGNPWLGTGLRGIVTRTDSMISVPKIDLIPGGPHTFIFDTELPAFTGTTRTLFACLLGGSYMLQFGAEALTNTFYYAGTILRSGFGFTPKARTILAFSNPGSVISFYQDGVVLGTASSGIKSQSGTKAVRIGSSDPVNTQPWAAPIYEFMLFNYAMQADEIAQYYYRIRGLSS